ncbi:MAG: amidohydrolase, partial [Aestuariibacter sp.]|nr:amidohydrolase [Aestuariibacter sp.]
HYDFNDDVLATGIQLLVALAEDYLSEKEDRTE